MIPVVKMGTGSFKPDQCIASSQTIEFQAQIEF